MVRGQPPTVLHMHGYVPLNPGKHVVTHDWLWSVGSHPLSFTCMGMCHSSPCRTYACVCAMGVCVLAVPHPGECVHVMVACVCLCVCACVCLPLPTMPCLCLCMPLPTIRHVVLAPPWVCMRVDRGVGGYLSVTSEYVGGWVGEGGGHLPGTSVYVGVGVWRGGGTCLSPRCMCGWGWLGKGTCSVWCSVALTPFTPSCVSHHLPSLYTTTLSPHMPPPLLIMSPPHPAPSSCALHPPPSRHPLHAAAA